MTNKTWVPEVGEECEYLYAGLGGKWKQGQVIAYHNDFVWIMEDDGEPCTFLKHSLEFRPLPTDEDRAVEEMVSIVTNCKVQSVEGRLRELYRAGYRKQEEPAWKKHGRTMLSGNCRCAMGEAGGREPVEDMTDPANWREGDLIECIDNMLEFCHKGGIYIVNEDHLRHPGCVRIKRDDDGDKGMPNIRHFRFHSRP